MGLVATASLSETAGKIGDKATVEVCKYSFISSPTNDLGPDRQFRYVAKTDGQKYQMPLSNAFGP